VEPEFFPVVLALLWMILMLGAFYALLVRPQRRNMAAHRALMVSLVEGDEVMTMGGIYGRIQKLDDEVVELEVAPGTSFRVARSAISRKVEN
jgi:preprotein translocase subunit YajC